MNLIEQIRAKYLELRKAHSTAAVASLSTLIGEIENLAKAGKGELTDAVVVTVIKKFIKNIDETIKANSEHGNHTAVERLADEKKLYEQFLPKQLTEAELKFVIDELVANGLTDVGDVMKALKINHHGHYDGALASRILKAKF